jgi:hypothetical protein
MSPADRFNSGGASKVESVGRVRARGRVPRGDARAPRRREGRPGAGVGIGRTRVRVRVREARARVGGAVGRARGGAADAARRRRRRREDERVGERPGRRRRRWRRRVARRGTRGARGDMRELGLDDVGAGGGGESAREERARVPRVERRTTSSIDRSSEKQIRAVLYKRMSGWSSKASVGVERRRGRVLKARGGRRETTGKVLKERRSPRDRGRMGTSV